MPRIYQTIQTKYWQYAKEAKLSLSEIAVEFYLMTCRDCGPAGVFIAHPETVAFYMGETTGGIRSHMRSLEKKKRIFIDDGGWVLIRGKWEHEPSKSPKIQQAALNEVSTSPPRLQKIFMELYSDTFTVEIPGIIAEVMEIPLPVPIEKVLEPEPDEPPVKIKPRKLKFSENVEMSEEEYDKLVGKFGKSKTTSAIEKLSNYKSASGKKYKSDYHAILNWVIDAVDKPNLSLKANKADYDPSKFPVTGDEEL